MRAGKASPSTVSAATLHLACGSADRDRRLRHHLGAGDEAEDVAERVLLALGAKGETRAGPSARFKPASAPPIRISAASMSPRRAKTWQGLGRTAGIDASDSAALLRPIRRRRVAPIRGRHRRLAGGETPGVVAAPEPRKARRRLSCRPPRPRIARGRDRVGKDRPRPAVMGGGEMQRRIAHRPVWRPDLSVKQAPNSCRQPFGARPFPAYPVFAQGPPSAGAPWPPAGSAPS